MHALLWLILAGVVRCYTAAAGTSYPHISTGAYTMELAAAKRAFNGVFLAHLLLAAHLVAAGEPRRL